MSDSEDDVREQKLKFVLIGDGSSGKTSISTRYSQDQFDRQYNQTLGIDFFMKRIVLPGPTNVILSVHDIGGQTLGGQMLDKYLYGADVRDTNISNEQFLNHSFDLSVFGFRLFCWFMILRITIVSRTWKTGTRQP